MTIEIWFGINFQGKINSIHCFMPTIWILTSMSPGRENMAVLWELFLCNCRWLELFVPPTSDRLAPKLHCIPPCMGGLETGFTPILCTGRPLNKLPPGKVLPQLKQEKKFLFQSDSYFTMKDVLYWEYNW